VYGTVGGAGLSLATPIGPLSARISDILEIQPHPVGFGPNAAPSRLEAIGIVTGPQPRRRAETTATEDLKLKWRVTPRLAAQDLCAQPRSGPQMNFPGLVEHRRFEQTVLGMSRANS
jgi:hypothetical protein